ncbi:MAG: hypothetical protein JSS02_07355 [Planctomycetes bacterium]|nr:hypothetical protein [Planctomycetota bacterium]
MFRDLKVYMPRPKVDLKDPMFAAILAWLVPGLGHLYQRRFFKAALYSVCILGTFFTGLKVGHGQVVYFQWKQADNRTWAYLAQFWAGLPALPALAQSQLRNKAAFDVNYVPSAIQGVPYDGRLFDVDGSELGTLTGQATLEPVSSADKEDQFWEATVSGKLKTEQGEREIVCKVSQAADRSAKLDPEVAPWPVRKMIGRFKEEGGQQLSGRIEGGIPRSLWNRYCAPLEDHPHPPGAGSMSQLDTAHSELGGRFELGVVYTVIAGLLNVLAIYDALEGPAYDSDEGDEESPKKPSDPPPDKNLEKQTMKSTVGGASAGTA